MPAEPKLMLPFRLRVQSRNSFGVFAGVDGLTTRNRPAEVSWLIGVKSFTGW